MLPLLFEYLRCFESSFSIVTCIPRRYSPRNVSVDRKSKKRRGGGRERNPRDDADRFSRAALNRGTQEIRPPRNRRTAGATATAGFPVTNFPLPNSERLCPGALFRHIVAACRCVSKLSRRERRLPIVSFRWFLAPKIDSGDRSSSSRRDR